MWLVHSCYENISGQSNKNSVENATHADVDDEILTRSEAGEEDTSGRLTTKQTMKGRNRFENTF